MRNIVALLIFSCVLAGYGASLLPHDTIHNWFGPQSGILGLIRATLTGIIVPGGPYVVFPLIDVLYRQGVGIDIAVTLFVSSMMLALPTLPFELPFLGWRFAAVRYLIGFGFTLLTGTITWIFFGV
ncbi:MAG: permease [Proteobacteria bacterium]|nr:permease [Pseudomonadota bacterium]